jgi:hypothetical protein
MEFPSSALISLISVIWRRMKIWRSASTKSGTRPTSPTNWLQYWNLRSSNVEWQNKIFRAAIQMTMPSVVRNYLRWFELNRRKKAVGPSPLFPSWRPLWRRLLFPRFGESSTGWTLRPEFSAQSGGGKDGRPGRDPQLADEFSD